MIDYALRHDAHQYLKYRNELNELKRRLLWQEITLEEFKELRARTLNGDADSVMKELGVILAGRRL